MFLRFWPTLPGPGRQPNEPFFGLNLAKIRVFGALDWLASISEAEIMAQTPSFWQNSKSFKKGIICPLRAKFGQP